MDPWRGRQLSFVVLSALWILASAVTRYSIPEEIPVGTVIANIATDLGLDAHSLLERKVKLDYIHSKKYLEINKDTGELYIAEKIDREYLCPAKASSFCFLKMDVIIENPIRIFNIELEIMDINDNAPQFRRERISLDVSESATPGERFSITNAVDADVGENSIETYYLSDSDTFTIEIQSGSDGTKYVDLVLKASLDREKQAVHTLTLTAVDGGVPARSGTASIIVQVLDTNDNAPQFDRQVYSVDLIENAPIGTLIMQLNATDLDEGVNAEVIYSFTLYTSEETQEKFSLDPSSGEIRVKDMIDFEEVKSFEMYVEAKDKAVNPLSGTVIAVISVSDRDSGDNGKVVLSIHNAPSTILPFALNKSSEDFFELTVTESLDREVKNSYEITLHVTDRGTPPLTDNETIILTIQDINDNAPSFPQSLYTIHLMENNEPGMLLASLTAHDPDLNENQYLVYVIIEKEIANTSMSMLFSINPENGNLYALCTFDYEREKEFLFHIEARDSGLPPLSSNVTVHIIILDQNDNTPLIVSPWRPQGAVIEEVIPRSSDKGSLVTKVIALDADSMQNSRITYQFLQITDTTLFSLDQYNGEIRTTRMFSYRDPRHQHLVIIARDNGDPPRSATVTIKISTVEQVVTQFTETTEVPIEYDLFTDLNLYLLIGLGSVLFLLLITILVIIVLKCQEPEPSQAAPQGRNSIISQRNSSTIADSTLISSDAYWYSLFLAETRKGKVVVRQPLPNGAGFIVSSIPGSAALTETSASRSSTLQESSSDLP
uniref:Cadherin domain-containing protein n=1 Tax=Cyprinus carpio carpio TaxID=630221 RepID=A0A9J7YJP9_CYPCA